MTKPVQVTILGQQYTIRGESGPEEIRRVAAFVNEQVDLVVSGRKSVDTLNTAILALLNVSGAFLQLRDEGRRDEEALRKVLDRLEDVLPKGESD